MSGSFVPTALGRDHLQLILANHILPAAATDNKVSWTFGICATPYHDLRLAARFQADIDVIFSQVHDLLLPEFFRHPAFQPRDS